MDCEKGYATTMCKKELGVTVTEEKGIAVDTVRWEKTRGEPFCIHHRRRHHHRHNLFIGAIDNN